MLVIFEGLDNCGKTTLVQMIKDYYLKLGIDAEISKEFETNIGKELKKMAKEAEVKGYSTMKKAELVEALSK